ncbi:MAG TPA: TrbC/VirB2 family protein [Candidatus Paceibacterota bacterium]|nr:TrbC/VirB2 family protein [Candidatus Paceibacterota bacterium]
MKQKFVRAAQAAAATVLAFGPAVALAQLSQPRVPGGLGGSGEITTGTLERLLNQLANFLITASVIIAVIIIVYGGIMWMYKGADEGKKWVTKGVIGVAIVLAVGLILRTVARIVQSQSIT